VAPNGAGTDRIRSIGFGLFAFRRCLRATPMRARRARRCRSRSQGGLLIVFCGAVS